MLPNEIKFKLKNIWDILQREPKVRDSLQAAEQIILLFLVCEKNSVFFQELINSNSPLLKEKISRAITRITEISQLEYTWIHEKVKLSIESEKNLRESIEIIESIFSYDEVSIDLIIEHILEIALNKSKSFLNTPRHIVKLMCALPEKHGHAEEIADLYCGAGGFLIEYQKYRLFSSENGDVPDFFQSQSPPFKNWKDISSSPCRMIGVEKNISLAKLATLNTVAHNMNNNISIISEPDWLGRNSTFDLILSNPPFGRKYVSASDFAKDGRLGQKSPPEIVFVENIIKSLKEGGQAVLILPENFLFGKNRTYIEARAYLIDRCHIEAVISLPKTTFRPHSSVKASIILLRKEYSSHAPVWFYNLENVGFNSSGRKLKEDSLNIFYERFRKRNYYDKETPDSFFVPLEKIKANEYKLSFFDYKEYQPAEDTHIPSYELKHQLRSLEEEIQEEMNELFKLMQEDYD